MKPEDNNSVDELEHLLKALEDKDWIVAREAAEKLGVLRNPKTVGALAAALDWDGDNLFRLGDVQMAAAAALVQLGDARGLTYLTQCLRADSLYVRQDARKALEALGISPKR